MKYKIFWCKVNKYYLNQRLDFFSETSKNNDNDLIIASCVVTDKAKYKFLKEIKHNYNNSNHIYLTGCAAFDKWKAKTMDNFLKLYPELEEFKDKIVLLWEWPDSKNSSWTSNESQWNLYARKFLVIQNGCDSYCTFCLTVHKRGTHLSIPEKDIIEQINDFSKKWWQEVILTWVNLCAWWANNTNYPSKTKFDILLQSILKNTSVPRIRISSLWPEFLNDNFFKVIWDKRFLPHFHFSIQSFSNNILKSMKRHYSSNQLNYVLQAIKTLKNKQMCSIWADIITSFPAETQQDFEETLLWIQKYNITKIHSFPFSPHNKWEQVPAGLFPNQINDNIKKERQKKIIALWDQIRFDFIQQNIWLQHSVLIEGQRNWKRLWRTENYIQVWLKWDFKRWELVNITLSNEDLA